MDMYTIKAIEKEIEKLEQTKRENPGADYEWLYEPDLSILKSKLEGK